MATQEERNARLDALSTSAKDWAKQRRTYLEQQAAFCKKVLKGRTGAERLNNASVVTATSLLVDEIDQFLSG